MGLQKTEIRHKEIDGIRKKNEEEIKYDLTLSEILGKIPEPEIKEIIIRTFLNGLYMYDFIWLSIIRELARSRMLSPTAVKIKDKGRHRIKTTVGFDIETYTKLKILSIVLNENMQDIIAKALHEYFEKDDIKGILAKYSTELKSSDSTDSK